MFTEVRSKTDQLALVETPFGGRYCGKIPPRQRISLYKTMVFIFLSDRDNVTAARFSGTFSFIPDGNGVFFQICGSTYLGLRVFDPDNQTHLSKGLSYLNQNDTKENSGVVGFVALAPHRLDGSYPSTTNQHFYSTIATKWNTPCERARKTKPENDFVCFVAFCLRYLGIWKDERCLINSLQI